MSLICISLALEVRSTTSS